MRLVLRRLLSFGPLKRFTSVVLHRQFVVVPIAAARVSNAPFGRSNGRASNRHRTVLLSGRNQDSCE
jgi:hypothetical protein